MNGWWNPEGANRFKLKNVRVTGAVGANGVVLRAESDGVLGMSVISVDGASTAKMVDLDPDQQLVSMIYGLTVVVTNGAGQDVLRGVVEPAPFSDIWSRGRGLGAHGPDERASVFYQTVVRVTWGDVSGSAFLQALRMASGDLLSMKFQLDGYSMGGAGDRLFSGRIVGTLGVAAAGEPRHWQPGRHLAGGDFSRETASPWFGLDPSDIDRAGVPEPVVPANFGVVVVDRTRGKLRVDLGNALTIDVTAADPPRSPIANQGRLSLALLQQNGTATDVAEIPYSTELGWYEQTAGIVEVPADRALTAQELAAVDGGRLAVVSERDGVRSPLLQEPPTHVRADMFVARMNAGDAVEVEFRASSLGRPMAGERVRLRMATPGNPQFPVGGLTFPSEVVCDAEGRARVTLRAADPGATRFFYLQTRFGPRVHVDGQVYVVNYVVGNALSWNPSDFLSVLVWNVFRPDEPPTWHGSMKPVFAQYGNLYPFMTTQGNGPNADSGLDLADYEQLALQETREKIIMVMESAETDPRYMPVTRDLSRSKRDAMLRWLRDVGVDGNPLLGVAPGPDPAPGPLAAVPPGTAAVAAEAEKSSLGDMDSGRVPDSKELAGRMFAKFRASLE